MKGDVPTNLEFSLRLIFSKSLKSLNSLIIKTDDFFLYVVMEIQCEFREIFKIELAQKSEAIPCMLEGIASKVLPLMKIANRSSFQVP